MLFVLELTPYLGLLYCSGAWYLNACLRVSFVCANNRVLMVKVMNADVVYPSYSRLYPHAGPLCSEYIALAASPLQRVTSSAGSVPLRAIVDKKHCEIRGLFMSLVIHY